MQLITILMVLPFSQKSQEGTLDPYRYTLERPRRVTEKLIWP